MSGVFVRLLLHRHQSSLWIHCRGKTWDLSVANEIFHLSHIHPATLLYLSVFCGNGATVEEEEYAGSVTYYVPVSMPVCEDSSCLRICGSQEEEQNDVVCEERQRVCLLILYG